MPAPRIELRRQFSELRLTEVRTRIEAAANVRDVNNLCIYTTGSYGRLEASQFSDLDLFFIVDSAATAPSKLQKILIDAALIEINNALNLPPFSGDGEYLEIHDLEEMEKHLGSRVDDYENYFTARLLLLLESRPIVNEELYDAALMKVINWYFRDFEGHQSDFRPVFLANDILRFWKTLCLNYENRRNRATAGDLVREKHKLKNLKLKFSRMLTCYSTLIAIGAKPALTPETVLALTRQTPWARLRGIGATGLAAEKLQSLEDQYDWFLQFTDLSEETQLESLADTAVSRGAFERAALFGDAMYGLLMHAVPDNVKRFYVI